MFLSTKDKSRGTIDSEDSIFDRFVINHNSFLGSTWPMFAVVLSLTSSLHYAYYAAFIEELSLKEKESFYAYDLAYNIIFFFDLLL